MRHLGNGKEVKQCLSIPLQTLQDRSKKFIWLGSNSSICWGGRDNGDLWSSLLHRLGHLRDLKI